LTIYRALALGLRQAIKGMAAAIPEGKEAGGASWSMYQNLLTICCASALLR
jgi:hypothetical protein